MRTATATALFLMPLLFACGGGDGDAAESEGTAQSAGAEDEANAAPEQSLHDAIELMCNGWVDVPETQAPTDEERAPLVMQWIDGQLTNPRALELFDVLMQVAPFQRRQEMSRFAEDQGITECAVLAYWPESQE